MLEGGIVIQFLYIVGDQTYYNHFNRGLMKIIPKKYIPTKRVKILEHILSSDGSIIGRVGGVFLNNLNLEKEELIEELVLAIGKLKDENTNRLIMEDLSLFNMDDLRLIERKTNLKIVNGIRVFIFFLPWVLREIYKNLNKSLKEKEVLIIGDDEELTKQIIESLYKEIGFITLAGDYESTIENISKYILEKTGLSIFYSKNLDKILGNYPIIINFKDNYYLNIGKLREKAIIFDFSMTKGLRDQINEGRRMVIVEDFLFLIDYLDIKENKFIKPIIPSYLYEQFNRLDSMDFAGLSIDGECYSLNNFIDYQIKTKGRF